MTSSHTQRQAESRLWCYSKSARPSWPSRGGAWFAKVTRAAKAIPRSPWFGRPHEGARRGDKALSKTTKRCGGDPWRCEREEAARRRRADEFRGGFRDGQVSERWFAGGSLRGGGKRTAGSRVYVCGTVWEEAWKSKGQTGMAVVESLLRVLTGPMPVLTAQRLGPKTPH